jgi:23S rRNA (pseudouridine1915-N3)-methyltransferase
MRLKIIAVGRLGRPHYRAAADVYKDRLKHYQKFEEVEVREARKVERRNTAPALKEEGKRLMAAVPDGAVIIAMDERGKELDSQRFAALIEEQMIYGRSGLCFLIGGALGLDPEVRKGATRTLALSKMTMPHELARVVLMEQIYRAMTIIRGEPYHK